MKEETGNEQQIIDKAGEVERIKILIIPPEQKHPKRFSHDKLMDEVVDETNFFKAMQRVIHNNGAPGVDGVRVEEIQNYIQDHWPNIKASLLQGRYKPLSLLRKEIRKDNGGMRQLGIPTVIDRVIQQAILQILVPIFDDGFSPSSFGYRPNCSAHRAIKETRKNINKGYDWIIAIDIEKYFDTINHQVLIDLVQRKVQDNRLIKTISAFLKSDVMLNGVKVEKDNQGICQGGPLSPLLANIYLDILDKALEARGHKFARYADDLIVLVKTKRSGLRVLRTIRTFVEKELRLKINDNKTTIERPWETSFLGFTFDKDHKIRITGKSEEKLKKKIKSLTHPYTRQGIHNRIQHLNQYLQGWIGHYYLSDDLTVINNTEKWIWLRLTMCLISEWRKSSTDNKAILSMPKELIEFVKHRGKLGEIAHKRLTKEKLGLNYWNNQGLVSLTKRYTQLKGISHNAAN